MEVARACTAAIAEARAEVARAVAQSKQQAKAADEERSRADKALQVCVALGPGHALLMPLVEEEYILVQQL